MNENLRLVTDDRNEHELCGWRPVPRKNDRDYRQLTRESDVGELVYFDYGPGVRVSGRLLDWDVVEGLVAVDLGS